MNRRRLFLMFLVWLCCVIASPVMARETVKITFMFSSGGQRAVFDRQVSQFKTEFPDIDVVVTEEEQESYKQNVAEWLSAKTSRSDVLFWFGGTKLRGFVAKGWVEPIGDLWKARDFDGMFTKVSKAAVSVDKQIYGLPLSYYQWGFYYRKSLFRQFNLQPPQTWKEFLDVAEKLRTNGVVPVALGSKDRWPAAGWFDYLDLRINGLAFHQSLMDGKVSYTDPRVKEVFRVWRELIDHGYFLSGHDQLDWRAALPFLYRAKAGMMLMGNFIVPQLPKGVRDDIGFFRFPKIRPDLPFYEEAPVDILMIPSNASNKSGAKKFLAFMGQADVQYALNREMGMISPNRTARLGEDEFIQAGARILNEAEGISQFYDRDTPPEIFNRGMEVFAKFMEHPEKIDELLDSLEATRKRVFR